jgi:hypothetical protein
MNPKRKLAFLYLIVLVLMAPYFWFVIHFSSQYPSGHWPDWLTLPTWFTVNFLILLLAIKRIFRGQVVDAEKARIARAKSVTLSTRLVILWSLIFLYGVKETLQGKIPLNRALFAGTFLLFFIGIFGWRVYRAKREKASLR